VSDAEPRPRPQYGEYATPEEQRARIRRPEVTEALEAGEKPVPAASPVPAAPQPVRRGPFADRVATFGLLIYGLVNVVATIVQLLDFPRFVEDAFRPLGVEASFTNLTAGYVWGAVAAAVFGIGWLVTAVATVRRLRRGRISFWVPLVGFVVVTMLGSLCLIVPLSGDPGFTSAVLDRLGN